MKKNEDEVVALVEFKIYQETYHSKLIDIYYMISSVKKNNKYFINIYETIFMNIYETTVRLQRKTHLYCP